MHQYNNSTERTVFRCQQNYNDRAIIICLFCDFLVLSDEKESVETKI